MKSKIILLSVILLFIAVLGAFFLLKNEEPKEKFIKTDYAKIDLNDIKNLMIVAHPDDDVLWGGKELIENDYLVVCITCGSDIKRVKEFEKVMGETGDKYAMLGFPDKTNGQKDNWKSVYDDIKEDLKKIYGLKKWDKVITHNPEGEYGHIHHVMTSEMASDFVEHDKLYYFGKYYTKKELEEDDLNLTSLDEKTLERKEEILNLYATQDTTIHKTLGHMIPYEDVVSYVEWMNTYEEN